jgi:hypothetical protein
LRKLSIPRGVLFLHVHHESWASQRHSCPPSLLPKLSMPKSVPDYHVKLSNMCSKIVLHLSFLHYDLKLSMLRKVNTIAWFPRWTRVGSQKKIPTLPLFEMALLWRPCSPYLLQVISLSTLLCLDCACFGFVLTEMSTIVFGYTLVIHNNQLKMD